MGKVIVEFNPYVSPMEIEYAAKFTTCEYETMSEEAKASKIRWGNRLETTRFILWGEKEDLDEVRAQIQAALDDFRGKVIVEFDPWIPKERQEEFIRRAKSMGIHVVPMRIAQECVYRIWGGVISERSKALDDLSAHVMKHGIYNAIRNAGLLVSSLAVAEGHGEDVSHLLEEAKMLYKKIEEMG